MGAVKRLLLGRPLASEEAEHQLLPKVLALPVFASDALSSVAYATEEILHVLILAGVAALSKSIPIAVAVSLLMAIVITSYRQTVRAYPGGGGSYIVSRDNLGAMAGLIAGAALLIDYVLTVAVSIAAGTFALTSLVESLRDHKLAISLVFLMIVTVMNLRGSKESGSLFAIPTYAFVLSIATMLVVGFARCTFGECPRAHISPEHLDALQPLGLLLLLRAFASGATALTGVEAIADGVPAFRGRRPAEQARNAATTLAMLGVIAISMFAGITVLAHRVGAIPSPERSVVSQIADAVFGGGVGFIVVQIATMLILVLAANTAYQDFPRLSSILAKDRFMPRQFINRGDRLVFSNGVLVLASAAALLLIAFKAEVSALIQLYVVGVFTSFTLSQFGMVQKWRKERPPGWKRYVALNGVGSATTAVVLVVVSISKFGFSFTKFQPGAWMVFVFAPLLVLMFRAISRHYKSVSLQLRRPEERPPVLSGTRVVVLVARSDEATMRALGYARSLRPLEVRAVHVGRGDEAALLQRAWDERRLPVPLEIVQGDPHNIVDPVRSYVRALGQAENECVTVVIPEVFKGSGARHLLSRRRTLLLKASLLFERRIVLTDVPTRASENWSQTQGTIAPTRVIALVLVSAVHNATLRALEYARTLSPTQVRAVTFNIDPGETRKVIEDWGLVVDDISLDVLDSPYREVTRPLVKLANRLRAETPDAVVSIIVPEFVVAHWWHQFLHNQTALAIKNALQFEQGVVLTSVPFHLK